MVRKAIFLGGVVCVVALVLLIWWSGGERKKSGSPSAGKQETVTPQRESRSAFNEWIRSWILPAEQSSQSGGSEPKDIEEAVRKTFLAYNRQDLRAFKAGWTEKGFQRAYERPKEKVIDFIPLTLLSFRPYTIGEFSNTAVSGETAATEVGLTYGEVHEVHRFSLIREGDAWRIDHDEKLAPIPEGVTVVNAKLQYFNIRLDQTQAPRGTVAFKISNTDTREHEFILKKVTESDNEETVGMTKHLKPGENETLTLKLKPGRYVALCNMVSRDGVPYASGMRTDFLIE